MATGHLGHQVSARRIVIVIFVTWYPLEFLVDYPLPLSFAIKCSYLQCHLVNLVIVLVRAGLRVRVCLRANVKIEWCVCTLSPSPSCSMEKSFFCRKLQLQKCLQNAGLKNGRGRRGAIRFVGMYSQFRGNLRGRIFRFVVRVQPNR